MGIDLVGNLTLGSRDLNSKITNQNIASKIHITSSKGVISGISAMRTGNVISIAFILTLNQSVSAGSSLGCTATFDDSALKPIARHIGGTSISNVDTINIDPTASGASLNANARDALGHGLAFWLLYTYICEG